MCMLEERLSSEEHCGHTKGEDNERGTEPLGIVTDLLRSAVDEACGWSYVVRTAKCSVGKEGRRLNERGVGNRSRVEDASRGTIDDGRPHGRKGIARGSCHGRIGGGLDGEDRISVRVSGCGR